MMMASATIMIRMNTAKKVLTGHLRGALLKISSVIL